MQSNVNFHRDKDKVKAEIHTSVPPALTPREIIRNPFILVIPLWVSCSVQRRMMRSRFPVYYFFPIFAAGSPCSGKLSVSFMSIN